MHRAGNLDRLARRAALAQLALLGQIQELVVRHAEPEKVGKAAGQFQVAHAGSTAGLPLRPIGLDAVEEFRCHQYRPQRCRTDPT